MTIIVLLVALLVAPSSRATLVAANESLAARPGSAQFRQHRYLRVRTLGVTMS